LLDLPEADSCEGQPFGGIESAKAVVELISRQRGDHRVNEDITDDIGIINSIPMTPGG
jgi:glycine cleavage system H lipoate-binding protein